MMAGRGGGGAGYCRRVSSANTLEMVETFDKAN